jgi:hypothetical protein
MKRALFILFLGAALGVLGAAATYWSMTARHRALLQQDQPELAWLRTEFEVAPDDFTRISALHQAYLPRCAELCQRISSCEARIRDLLDQTDQITPDIEELLMEAAHTRVECQKSMLEHFFQVSGAMPPEQGRRYLAWVKEKTFHMDHEPGAPREASHGHQGHH